MLQPKYETQRSRDRIEAFLGTLFHQPLDAFARLLRERFAARYLLIDMNLVWGARYQAGLPISAWHPIEGTAAFELLNPNPRVYRHVPGFKLLYKSEDDTAFWRLYELDDRGRRASARRGRRPEGASAERASTTGAGVRRPRRPAPPPPPPPPTADPPPSVVRP